MNKVRSLREHPPPSASPPAQQYTTLPLPGRGGVSACHWVRGGGNPEIGSDKRDAVFIMASSLAICPPTVVHHGFSKQTQRQSEETEIPPPGGPRRSLPSVGAGRHLPGGPVGCLAGLLQLSPQEGRQNRGRRRLENRRAVALQGNPGPEDVCRRIRGREDPRGVDCRLRLSGQRQTPRHPLFALQDRRKAQPRLSRRAKSHLPPPGFQHVPPVAETSQGLVGRQGWRRSRVRGVHPRSGGVCSQRGAFCVRNGASTVVV